jgi:hypothetical protein
MNAMTGEDANAKGMPQAPVEAVGTDRTVPVLLMPAVVGAVVALTLGVYGRAHPPASLAVNVAGFSGPLEAKVWLATGAVTAALVQLGSALVMYGRMPGIEAPEWLPALHRWSGRVAFLLAVPVAVHCLYALGFQAYDLRTLVHSVAGCLFFGAFTVKMLALTRHGTPGWALPVLGGAVFTVLVRMWLSSSLWFFTTTGLRF